MKILLHQRPKISEDVLWRVEEGNAVLFNEETGDPCLLNETGTRIFEHCSGDDSILQVVDKLVEEYEGERAVIEEEVLGILQELAGMKLIRMV